MAELTHLPMDLGWSCPLCHEPITAKVALDLSESLPQVTESGVIGESMVMDVADHAKGLHVVHVCAPLRTWMEDRNGTERALGESYANGPTGLLPVPMCGAEEMEGDTCTCQREPDHDGAHRCRHGETWT